MTSFGLKIVCLIHISLILVSCFIFVLFYLSQVASSRNKVYLNADNLLLNLGLDATDKYVM